VWIDLFDGWGEQEFGALAASGAAGGSFEVALVGGGAPDAMAATRRSLPVCWPVRVVGGPADWAGFSADWILVVAAGEVLAAQAAACFSLATRRWPDARGFCADVDTIDADGRRSAPEFRPPPDAWLLRTEFFARGAWLFHRRSHENSWACLPADAEEARLALARAGPSESLRRISLILTHCPPTQRGPARNPTRRLSAATPRVSVIVPSACRSRHVLRCLRRLVATTAYPDFEILVAVSGVGAAGRDQEGIMRRLASLPHVRVINSGIEIFNFAAVNNSVVARADGELLLLLNDDVAPLEPDWLHRMVTYACERDGAVADIVGARLLYGNAMVQHGGVIMGLANLCEHAFRLAECHDSGPQGLGQLDRRVSAVTAACMLVRRNLYESLGGLDEEFAIALNDVDFCLRAGQAGAVIVQAAGVELYHFESMSLGRHYQGGRAHLEAIEVRRLRRRWGATISADPYYHPCASLELGREFQPGFPPRQTPLSWIGEDTLAPH
jgi:GT2 family glycosyltransferase